MASILSGWVVVITSLSLGREVFVKKTSSLWRLTRLVALYQPSRMCGIIHIKYLQYQHVTKSDAY